MQKLIVSEKKLIVKLKTGCQTAFETLYNRYGEKIFNVGIRFGLSEEDSSEVVQDVFVKVWERRLYLRSDLSFNAYLLTITKNYIIKKARKNTTSTAFNKYYSTIQNDVDNSTENIIVYADLFNITNAFIKTLPNQQQQIFKLSKIDQLSNKEISERLNLSLRTVENHIFRASLKLRCHLKKLGIS